FVVGFVVFIILMIINFIVVTKVAERTPEVSARFPLDARPGQQLAMSPDLHACLCKPGPPQTRTQRLAIHARLHCRMTRAEQTSARMQAGLEGEEGGKWGGGGGGG
ncbi:FHIPEP family type III secretion protein, partial [Escherichia coli]|uniref:FHIPEP family type III secretion protein n=1 Tax=Escherichia coli TaxID=562 RepID=UPI00148555B6